MIKKINNPQTNNVTNPNYKFSPTLYPRATADGISRLLQIDSNKIDHQTARNKMPESEIEDNVSTPNDTLESGTGLGIVSDMEIHSLKLVGSEKDLRSENVDDVSTPHAGCYAVNLKQDFKCSYCGEHRPNCNLMGLHSCDGKDEAMLRCVKQENTSDQRPEGIISGVDIIEYTVGMTFYCTNNCTTSLKLNSIKGRYDRCGLDPKAREKKGDNKIYLQKKKEKKYNV